MYTYCTFGIVIVTWTPGSVALFRRLFVWELRQVSSKAICIQSVSLHQPPDVGEEVGPQMVFSVSLKNFLIGLEKPSISMRAWQGSTLGYFTVTTMLKRFCFAAEKEFKFKLITFQLQICLTHGISSKCLDIRMNDLFKDHIYKSTLLVQQLLLNWWTFISSDWIPVIWVLSWKHMVHRMHFTEPWFTFCGVTCLKLIVKTNCHTSHLHKYNLHLPKIYFYG